MVDLTYVCPNCGNEVADERMADRTSLEPELHALLDIFWEQERANCVCEERGHHADS